MNEHITTDYGYLAGYSKQGKFNFGSSYYVDVDSIRQQVEQIIVCPISELKKKRQLARAKFEAVDSAFRRDFVNFVMGYT